MRQIVVLVFALAFAFAFAVSPATAEDQQNPGECSWIEEQLGVCSGGGSSSQVCTPGTIQLTVVRLQCGENILMVTFRGVCNAEGTEFVYDQQGYGC